NHPPRITLNGVKGHEPLYITLRPGTSVTLNAAGTTDPNDDPMTYKWFWYPEAGRTTTASSPTVDLSASEGQRITVTPRAPGQAPVILPVTNAPALDDINKDF